MNDDIQNLITEIMLWMPKVGGAIFIILGFYIFSKIIRSAIVKGAKKLQVDSHLIALLARTGSITLVTLGIITALGTLGVNVSALVAGLGLTGFALGFALKDTISNLLSGVLILLYKPFEIGDDIEISGHTGRVVSIDLRYTELARQESKILIPNSKLFTDPITVLQIPVSQDLAAGENDKSL